MDNPPIQIPLSGAGELSREGPPSPSRPDPDNPPWGFWGALALLLMSLLLVALAQAALVFPYALRRGVPFTSKEIGEFAGKDPGAIVLELLALVIGHVLTLGLAWLLATRAGKFPFLQTLGWEWKGGLTFWRSAGLALGLLIVGTFIIKLTGSPENELDRIINNSRAAALVAAFAATFTAPLVEEIIFRGFLYSALRRLIGLGWAVLLVSLLFTLIHVPQYWPSFGVLGTILLLSFVLTAARARTGRLLPSYVIHLSFNAIQSFIIVLTPFLERLYPEQTAPAPGLLVELFVRLHGVAW